MAETDLTLAEIETKITRILKEVVNGDAFSTLLVYDTVNDLYEEVFNQPNKQVKVRKSDHNFAVVPDTALNGAIVAGALTMTFDDASDLPTAGTVLIDNEFIPYTNKVGNTVTTAASAVSVGHKDGATVRPCYALPATIDKERGQHLNVNGLPYDVISVEDILDTFSVHTRQYAIFNGYLVLPENSSDLLAIFTYTPALTRMDDPTDKPSLIPNNFRVSLLVHGSVGKLMLLDGQTGYERYYRPPEYAGDKGGGMFFDALRKFYATYGRQTDMSSKKTSPSVYD